MEKNSVMTIENLKEIMEKHIPIHGLEKDKGIYEFYEDGNLSIGVSFESEGPDGEKLDRYIYNLFVNGEYVNIAGYGTNENPIPDEVLKEMVQEWNIFAMLERDRERTYEEVKTLIGLVEKGLDSELICVEVDNVDMNELKVSIGDNWFWTPVSYIDNQKLLDSVPKEEMVQQIVDTMLGIKEELDEDEFLYYQYFLEDGLVEKLKEDLQKQMKTERDGWDRPQGFASLGEETIEMIFDKEMEEYSATMHDKDGNPRLPYINADSMEAVLREIVMKESDIPKKEIIKDDISRKSHEKKLGLDSKIFSVKESKESGHKNELTEKYLMRR